MQAAEAAKDEAERIAIACRWWDEAEPIEGTLGERYLVEMRAIASTRWPSSVRWHSKRRAIVCAVTDDAGELVAVQIIRVTSEARKDESRGPTKQSFGALPRGFMRLPGPADGPLCVAEGPETGLTIWAATGYEVLIVFGGLKRAAERLEGETRRIVICRDDDKRASRGDKAAKIAARNMRKAGLDVRMAHPFEVRRADKSDFNTLAQAQGLNAVRRRIDMAAIDEPRTGQNLVTVGEARERLGVLVGEFFDLVESSPPPIHALGVTVGTGKTEAALRHALRHLIELRKRGDERAIAFAVPQHSLSDEIAARFNAMARAEGWPGVRAEVWRGREAKKPGASDGETMCAEIETVRHALRLAVDVIGEICKVCAHKERCAYLAQHQRDAALWIVAHPMAFHCLPSPIEQRGLAALVVDESPWQAGLVGVEGHGVEIALDALKPGVLPAPPGNGPDGGQRLVDIRKRLALALDGEPDGPVRRAALEVVGFDAETGLVAGVLEWRRKLYGGPWRERRANETLNRMAALWRAVAALMAADGPVRSGWLELTRNRGGARVIRVTGRKDIGDAWRVPTLHVDAVLDVDLVRPLWPAVSNMGVLAVHAPHQTVRQATARSFAKSYLQPPKGEKGDDKSRAKARRAARAMILKRARELGIADSGVLVIGNKAVVQAMNLPPAMNVGWFGNIAGRDLWKDARLVVIIGRPMPASQDVERLAGALTGKAPLRVDVWYSRGDAFRLKREGESVIRVPAESDLHPDPTCEAIRERICAGELVQAIGRGRGVNRTAETPLEVLVLGDAILPMPVDEFLPDDFLQPNPSDFMLAEGGVAFESGPSAAQAYPSLWPSARAAIVALQRHRSEARLCTKSYRELPIGECALPRTVEFQAEGKGQKPQRAIYDPMRVSDPRAAIEAMVGPLAKFELVETEAVAPSFDAEAAIAAFLGESSPTLAEPRAVEPSAEAMPPPPIVPPMDQLAELARRWGRKVLNVADGRSAEPEPPGLVIEWPPPVVSADPVLYAARV